MSGLVRISVVLLFGLLLASAHGGRNAAAQTIFDPYIAAIFSNTSSTTSTNQQAVWVLDAYAQARRALRVGDRGSRAI